MKRMLKLLVACIGLLFASNSAFYARSAGKTRTPSATVTFWNGPEDNIRSDGLPYTDGVRGVLCLVRTDSNQELILNVVTSRRRLWYRFDLPSVLATDCFTGQAPTSESTGLSVAGFLNVHGIGAIQLGEVRAVRANFFAGSVGQFNFLDANGTPPSYPWSCSTNVAVFRQDQTHWYISTSVHNIETFIQTELGGDQIPDATGSPVTPGDTAQLNDTTTKALLGNYRMPFGITVECPTCSMPPDCSSRPCPIPQ